MPRAKKPLTPADVAGVKIEGNEDIPHSESLPLPTEESAAILVHKFLTDNRIKIKLDVVNELNTWDGNGSYLLNDKPLLRLVFTYEDDSKRSDGKKV